jgi:hypothetical protein
VETGMANNQISEEKMVHLVRNALLVAGQEMGDGDQWPVIKDTIYKIMKDWEDLKIERAVDEELKIHVYDYLQKMEVEVLKCEPEIRAQIEPKFRELREVCDAHFSDLDKSAFYYDENDAPEHVKRMNSILATLEGNKDE